MNDGNHLMAKRMGNKYIDHQTGKSLFPKKVRDTNCQPRCYGETMNCKQQTMKKGWIVKQAVVAAAKMTRWKQG